MRTLKGCREDDGAVAILVAILLSAVLLVVGALTVDLGSVWAARAGLSGAADAAALGAGALLPEDPRSPVDDQAVVDTAVRILCDDGNRRADWDAACKEGSGWATDGDPANGEVEVEQADPADYRLDAADADRAPWVVTVRTPPVHVSFGLARAAGENGTDVSVTAGARRGLPYPVGSAMALGTGPLWAGSPFSPYYVTVADLEAAHGVTFGRICLRTLPRSGGTTLGSPPTGDDGFVFGNWALDTQGGVRDDTDGNGLPNLQDSNSRSFEVTGASFGTPPPAVVDPASLTIYVGVADAGHTAQIDDVAPDGAGTWTIRFTTPDLRASPLTGRVPVWWVYDDGTTTSTSRSGTDDALDYPPSTATASSDCDPLPDGRGLVDATALDDADSTRAAVSGGLTTRLAPFGASPQAQQLPGRDAACDVAPATVPVPVALGDPAPDGANCVPLLTSNAVSAAELTKAWLDTDASAPGRLRSTCGTGATGTITGLGSGFDNTNLFSSTNGLLADGVSAGGLRDRIRAGLAADTTYARAITEAVFHCPRLLLVPVLDAEPPADASVRQAVVGYTYFWVSDTRTRDSRGRPLRGLMVTPAGQVVGIRGWAVDPGYVRGGDWAPHSQVAGVALPMSVPRRAVLVRTTCDGHPDSPCPAPASPP